MSFDPVNPADLGKASGFSHGLLAKSGGRVLFVAGQIGVVSGDTRSQPAAGTGDADARFVAQFDEALRRLLRVVAEAGGAASDIGRMTVFVTDMSAYRRSLKTLGAVWRARIGPHYPAMALVAVASLVEPEAVVEIEATAVIGGA